MGFFKKIKKKIKKTISNPVKSIKKIPKAAVKSVIAVPKAVLVAGSHLAKGDLKGATKAGVKALKSGPIFGSILGNSGVGNLNSKSGSILGGVVEKTKVSPKKSSSSSSNSGGSNSGSGEKEPINTGQRYTGYAKRRDPVEEGEEITRRLIKRNTVKHDDDEDVNRFERGLRNKLKGVA